MITKQQAKTALTIMKGKLLTIHQAKRAMDISRGFQNILTKL